MPTQVVSTEEFIPRPQNPKQEAVETLIGAMAAENSKKLGMTRRQQEGGHMLAAMNPNPKMMERINPIELNGGQGAERLCDRFDITRRELDEWALLSHQRAVAAPEAGSSASRRSTVGRIMSISTRRGGCCGRSSRNTAGRFPGPI